MRDDRKVAFKFMLVNTSQVEMRMIKIKGIGFVGGLNCVVMSSLEIRSLNLRKSELIFPSFIPHLTSCRFTFVGRQLLHVLQHLLRLISEMGLEISAPKDIVEALVAASQFGEMSNRKYLLMIAAKLCKDPEQMDTQTMIQVRRDLE